MLTSSRKKCAPLIETAAEKRGKMPGHVTLSAVRGEKNTRCLISLAFWSSYNLRLLFPLKFDDSDRSSGTSNGFQNLSLVE